MKDKLIALGRDALIVVSVVLFCTAAFAQTPPAPLQTGTYADDDDAQDWAQFDKSAAALDKKLEKDATAGFCARGPAHPKKGEVYIQYSRNAAGKCVGDLVTK